MKAEKLFKLPILGFIAFCMLIVIPGNASAADAKEYDFNKNKKIVITEQETYHASGDYSWVKYKPSANGYVTIQASDISPDKSGAKGYLTLYDSTKGQALSSKSIYYNTKNTKNPYWYQITFGLQKNQIYYFRVKANQPVKLTAVFKKVNDKSGEIRTKAPELKKNKAKTGLVTTGNLLSGWYKIKLNKKQKLQLYYNVKTRGTFRISVYAGTRRLGSRNIYHTSKQQKMTIYYKQPNGKAVGLDAGTYYIKIERANAFSSGYYTVKWK